MSRKGGNTTFEIRQLCIFHHAKGRKYTDIAKMLHIPKSTVGEIIRRYKNEDRVEFVPPPGRQKKKINRQGRACYS